MAQIPVPLKDQLFIQDYLPYYLTRSQIKSIQESHSSHINFTVRVYSRDNVLIFDIDATTSNSPDTSCIAMTHTETMELLKEHGLLMSDTERQIRDKLPSRFNQDILEFKGLLSNGNYLVTYRDHCYEVTKDGDIYKIAK